MQDYFSLYHIAVMDRLQILLLILSEFKQINLLLKLSENIWFFDNFKG